MSSTLEPAVFVCSTTAILAKMLKKYGSEVGISDAHAHVLAREMAHEICQPFKKQLVYIPEDLGFELQERDRQLWQAFTGSNHHQLAKQFDLSVQTVYALVKRIGAEVKKRREPQLPGIDEI
jgi:Mor family transcriptional regulator